MDETGKPVPWNALYDGVQVWPPAAETLTDVWLKPVGFTSQALYSDHPELKIGAQKVFADGHIEDADSVFSCSDASVASISDANLLSIVSNATTMLAVLKNDACRPAVVGVNVPDSDSKMTVIYHSPSNTTKTVTMYWRLLTDAASDSQPHGSVTMTSLATVFSKPFSTMAAGRASVSRSNVTATTRRGRIPRSRMRRNTVSFMSPTRLCRIRLPRRSRCSSSQTSPRPRPWAVSGAARKNCTTA